MKRASRKDSGEARLAMVTKEMKTPRRAKSVRVADAKQTAPQSTQSDAPTHRA
ncbi:MAG: hypothetical protein ABSH39_11040 [Candidatus Acidiferrum sp.]